MLPARDPPGVDALPTKRFNFFSFFTSNNAQTRLFGQRVAKVRGKGYRRQPSVLLEHVLSDRSRNRCENSFDGRTNDLRCNGGARRSFLRALLLLQLFGTERNRRWPFCWGRRRRRAARVYGDDDRC